MRFAAPTNRVLASRPGQTRHRLLRPPCAGKSRPHCATCGFAAARDLLARPSPKGYDGKDRAYLEPRGVSAATGKERGRSLRRPREAGAQTEKDATQMVRQPTPISSWRLTPAGSRRPPLPLAPASADLARSGPPRRPDRPRLHADPRPPRPRRPRPCAKSRKAKSKATRPLVAAQLQRFSVGAALRPQPRAQVPRPLRSRKKWSLTSSVVARGSAAYETTTAASQKSPRSRVTRPAAPTFAAQACLHLPPPRRQRRRLRARASMASPSRQPTEVVINSIVNPVRRHRPRLRRHRVYPESSARAVKFKASRSASGDPVIVQTMGGTQRR